MGLLLVLMGKKILGLRALPIIAWRLFLQGTQFCFSGILIFEGGTIVARHKLVLWLGLALLALGLANGTGGKICADDGAAKAKGLAVGDALPALDALNEQGNAWKSADYIGKKVVVIYFYPGDFTGGCIKHTQMFQELLVKFQEDGAEVVGVSGDEVANHRLFKDTYKLPQTFLAEPKGKLASALGVPVTVGEQKVRTRGIDGKPLMDDKGKSIIITRPSTTARWTYIVGSDGKILARRENVNPAKDAEEVLQLIKNGK